VKVLITTGERKFYSNGVDLDWLSKQDRDISMAYLTTLQHLFSTILTLPVVTIAAINGLCCDCLLS
jgi:enoyl-CoA hydratase/carnithine racemase